MRRNKGMMVEKKKDGLSQEVLKPAASSRDETQKQAGPLLSTEDDSGQDLSVFFGSNSRCVPVGTESITPGGRNWKESSKVKRKNVKFRCTMYEKKLLEVKAARSQVSVSEFCRRAVFQVEIKERLSEEQIEVYKMLSKYHNNFKSIGNMFRQKDPRLADAVHQLANEMRNHLNNLKK